MGKKKKSLYIYIWYACVIVFIVYLCFNIPSQSWLLSILNISISLILTTSVASFIGSIIEDRNWTNFISFLVKPIVSWAGLPAISATSMLTSFFSAVTANAMLVSSFNNKELSRAQMRLSAMCNSYMNYIYHSLRILYPIVAAIGLVGLMYFGLLFLTGFMVLIFAIFYFKKKNTACQTIAFTGEILKNKQKDTSWKKSISKSIKRTRALVKRMLLIAIPLFVFFSYLAHIGFFNFNSSSAGNILLDTFFPPEAFAVVAAMMGGMISAASVAAGFIKSGDLDSAHVLLALFAGNLISMPMRTLRRSLPSAMSVFPSKDALIIVLLNQGSRFVMTLLLMLSLILLLHYKII